jgi:NAD(P)H dehydrogenase (quinone)
VAPRPAFSNLSRIPCAFPESNSVGVDAGGVHGIFQLKGNPMYAVIGVTGQVGGAVARNLLAAHQPVRAIVRDASKGNPWIARGCEVAVADVNDPAALAKAFAGADAVFILIPPVFDPAPGFPEARSIAASLRAALEAARPARVVYLSTIGAQATHTSLLTQHTLTEKILRELPLPITFFRPGWFMENCIWDVTPAREQGTLPSFLQPLDKPVPMIATADIGRVAAELLQENWTGHRVVELEGPQRISPQQVAATFAKLLGRPVTAQPVPHDAWESLFRAQGMKNPEPRIQMLDGFNQGWIDFEGVPRKGTVPLEAVLRSLLER